jgi:hypothetical protein
MKTSLLEHLLGFHRHQFSRVFTIRRRTYQVCVGCGREFEYSWDLMHQAKPAASDNVHGPAIAIEQTEAPAA